MQLQSPTLLIGLPGCMMCAQIEFEHKLYHGQAWQLLLDLR
jgi:hypothetical protein